MLPIFLIMNKVANHRQAMYILMVKTKVSTFAKLYAHIMANSAA